MKYLRILIITFTVLVSLVLQSCTKCKECEPITKNEVLKSEEREFYDNVHVGDTLVYQNQNGVFDTMTYANKNILFTEKECTGYQNDRKKDRCCGYRIAEYGVVDLAYKSNSKGKIKLGYDVNYAVFYSINPAIYLSGQAAITSSYSYKKENINVFLDIRTDTALIVSLKYGILHYKKDNNTWKRIK